MIEFGIEKDSWVNNMNQTELIKALTLSGSAISNRWSTVMLLANEIKLNNAEVINFKWGDHWCDNEPKLYDIMTWSTYQDCIYLKFFIEKNDLYCDANIYDGSILDGCRTKLRFKTRLKLPLDFINKIDKYIVHSFEVYSANQYEKYLEKQKQEWIDMFQKQCLSN
jgi:hypothetical protein